MDDPKNSASKLRTPALSREGAPPTPPRRSRKPGRLRVEHARSAAYQAHRVEQARAAAYYTEAARWTEEYRRSVARCRLLGEMIRGGSPRSAAIATAATVTPLVTPEPAEDVLTTGEAA
jgi:hypothetical protein